MHHPYNIRSCRQTRDSAAVDNRYEMQIQDDVAENGVRRIQRVALLTQLDDYL